LSSKRALTPARLIAGLAAALAALPMLIAGATFAIQHPLIIFDGDAAVDELALIRSGHFEQLVGNYSRYGFSHPGPAWFYALDTVYQPLGAQSWAFPVAMLAINALAVLLIILVAWRTGGPPLAVAAAISLLIYVGAMGDVAFRGEWPPLAVILPMALMLLLAGLGAATSTPALAWALVAGSYEAQTHVGTVPTVMAVLVAAVAARLAMNYVAMRDPAREVRATSRWDLPLTIGGLVLAVVMWIPPLIDEVTGNPGNLTVLWNFFMSHGPQHHWLEALSALGHNLDIFELPQLLGSGYTDMAVRSSAHVAVVGVFAFLCLGLIGAGLVARDRFAQAAGVILLAAVAAITYSIRDVLGPVYEYLLLWVTTLPVVLALAWLELLLHLRLWRSTVVSRNIQVAAALIVLMVIGSLSAVRTAGFQALPPEPPNVQRAGYLSEQVEAAVDRNPNQPVLLELNSLEMWPMAAAIGLQLVKHGHPIRFHDEWLFMFGRETRIRGDERVAIVVVSAADAAAYVSAHPTAQLVASTDTHAVFLGRIA
jgi:hypothetical protein